jgi:hypothetical protein
MANTTVTFEVDAADAYWVRAALSDSMIRWGDLALAATRGERSDLNKESCLLIRDRAYRLYNEFTQQEMEQS